MTKQNRKRSVVETGTNSFIGASISILAAWFIYPLFGIHVTLKNVLASAAVFMLVSMVKNFWVRRGFNYFTKGKQTKRMSFIESVVSVSLGTLNSFLIVMYVFPYLEMEVSTPNAAYLTGVFTVIAVLRTYIIRRIFEFKRIEDER